jgi:hypothetical protein
LIVMTAGQLFTTFSYRGVQILHPVQNGVQMTPRGATHNRTGCSLEQNGVQRLHPIHQQRQLIVDVIAEQDQAAIEALDDRQRFAMFAAWTPSEKALADQLAIARLPAEVITDQLLETFMGFYVARPTSVHSAAGWCFELVKWAKRDKTRTAGAGAQTDEFDDTNIEWMNGGAK